MDIKIGDYVKYVEQLYSDIQTQNITTSNFITSFKLIVSANIREKIQTYVNTIKPLNNVRNSEIAMLNEVLNHYDKLENVYNNIQLKKQQNQAVKINKFSNFCDKIAQNPESFPDFDFKSAYDAICPSVPKTTKGGKIIYKNLTVKQLKEKAKLAKIPKYSSMLKAELIKSLTKYMKT